MDGRWAPRNALEASRRGGEGERGRGERDGKQESGRLPGERERKNEKKNPTRFQTLSLLLSKLFFLFTTEVGKMKGPETAPCWQMTSSSLRKLGISNMKFGRKG
jgi:hypothetical protein